MKPLVLLFVVFFAGAAVAKLWTGDWAWRFNGNLALCVMLFLTALGHFRFSKGMMMMIPAIIPYKREIVMVTGLFEIALGFCLLFPAIRTAAGVVVIAMLVLMLPANISAARRRVNYQTATYDGPGPAYLWFRLPMQALLIAWVLWFSVLQQGSF